RRFLVITLGVLAAGSFALSVMQANFQMFGGRTAAFYLLPARIWELLAGSLLAMTALSPANGKHTVPILAGLALLLAPYWLLDHESAFPGLFAVPSVAGTCLLIRYGADGWVGRILRYSPVVLMGRISYSLYLFHWPVIVFWNYCVGWQPGYADLAGMFLFSLALAWLSWQFVETPARLARPSRRELFACAAATFVVLLACTSFVEISKGMKTMIHPQVNKIEIKTGAWEARPFTPSSENRTTEPEGLVNFYKKSPSLMFSLGRNEGVPELVLIGDSHADSLSAGIDLFLSQHGKRGIYLHTRMIPLLGVQDPFPESTADYGPEHLVAWLARNPHIKTVLVCCRWSTRMTGTGYGRELFFSNHFPIILRHYGDAKPASPNDNPTLVRNGLRAFCQQVTTMQRQVILLGPVPELSASPIEVMQTNMLLGKASPMPCATVAEFMIRQESTLKMLGELANTTPLVHYLPIHSVMQQAQSFVIQDKGQFLYFDSHHLTAAGARYVLSKLDPAISDLL
ncbi:MAG: acyltransferase family protein, partial [Pseudomonadota bacterium]